MTTTLYAASPGVPVNVSGNTADTWTPDIAMLPSGRSAVVWTKDKNDAIYLRFLDAQGQTEGPPIEVTPSGAQGNRPSVAVLENGNLVVTYTALPSTAVGADIRAMVYTPQGTALTAQPVFVGVLGSTSVSPETIALRGGGFLTTFDAFDGDGDRFAVGAQITDADLTPVGDSFVVNQTTEGFQSGGDPVLLPDGGFAVTWRSREVDGSFYAVMLRFYNSDGTPRSNEIRVNQYASGSQQNSDITVLSDGRLVVSWDSDDQDFSGEAVYARIYAANGIPQTGEFQVNTRVFNDQNRSDVTATPDGGFIVVWTNALGSSVSDIRSQRYDAFGQAVGGEIILADGPDNLSVYPDVEFAPDGSARLIWYALDQGDGVGAVYVSRLDPGFEGTENSDRIEGDGGDNTMFGLGGDDLLVGGAGDDLLDGGTGSDTASYESATGAVSVYLAFDGRNVGGSSGADRFQSIENLTGSSFDDRLVGDGRDNVLDGLSGADVMKGKGGNDTFMGGDGDDRMRGGDGVDDMQGDGGADILLALSGNDLLDGGNGDDFLYGGRGADTLQGGEGDDALRGNIGADTLEGGAGADDLRGGGSPDNLDGGTGNDVLFGGGSADTLHGGAGNDSLTGGFGAGVLDGVRDTFVFAPSAQDSGGFDRIRDFENGIDRIDLSAFGFADFDTDVLPLASARSTGLRLDFGGGDVVFLDGISLSGFDASDVVLI